MHTDPVVNATLGPFLDTLPALGDVLSPEMWPPDLIPELQAPDSLVGTPRIDAVTSVSDTLLPGHVAARL